MPRFKRPVPQNAADDGTVGGVYSGFVIFQLSAVFRDRWFQITGVEEIDEIDRVMKQYGIPTSERVVTSVSPEVLRDLDRRLGDDRRPSLAAFWRLDARRVEDPDALVADLNRTRSAEKAYRELRTREPSVDPTNDKEAEKQLYLLPGPLGINAMAGWARKGGDGANANFIDLERGWHIDASGMLQHEDLPQNNFAILPGVPHDIRDLSRHHGTRVLGVVAAVDNDKGIVGIAPNTALVTIASHFKSDGTDGHIADAIAALLAHLISGTLSAGDVLLLEVETATAEPIEIDHVSSVAIADAVSCGLVVIEAAGNGNLNLDTIGPLNKDSGAIMVAASRCSVVLNTISFRDRLRPPGHIRDIASNFGAKIDCFAWGGPASVMSTHMTEANGVLQSTYSRFGATSAAAAIIAGVAVATQSMQKASGQSALTPAAMRQLLRDPANGTAKAATELALMGVMPDLDKVANALGIPAPQAPAAPTNIRIT